MPCSRAGIVPGASRLGNGPVGARGAAARRRPRAGARGPLSRPPPPADTLDEMIYLVYERQELIAETDSVEFLKALVRAHPDCAVKELTSGKLYKPRLVPKAS